MSKGILDDMKQAKSIDLSGHKRRDSLGHNAKYLIYSLINVSIIVNLKFKNNILKSSNRFIFHKKF